MTTLLVITVAVALCGIVGLDKTAVVGLRAPVAVAAVPNADAVASDRSTPAAAAAPSTENVGDTIESVGDSPELVPFVPRCKGDGTSGNRIAFYYAYLAGRPNRLDSVREALISVIERANDLVNRSARRFGADESLRIETDSACIPVLRAVELPADAAASFADTVAATGLTATDRKYVLFVDDDHFCGLATLDFDDSPGPGNANNRGPSWARVDAGCWTPLVTAHEIFHMLGAVQNSAPHHDGTGHCTDGYDVMCYASENGSPLTLVCRSRESMFSLDCGGDDYYNPDPAPNSYLATHWNTAFSSFLYQGGPPAAGRKTGEDTWVSGTGPTR